jgi:arylsulfatase A
VASFFVVVDCAAGQEVKRGRPNLILVMADDFGYECVGANGGGSYKTPNLDRMAATGMRFDRCYVQPLCTPTRVQLMTGQYNVRNYIRFGLLDPQATTFAQLLKRAGYLTCIVGKWQLAGGFEGPGHFGFDDYCLWQLTRRPPRYANPGLEINGKQVDFSKGEYGPDLVHDHALDFIRRAKDRPFFLYYPMILTHSPYQPTPDSAEWNAKAIGEKAGVQKKHFADMTAYMDKLMGKLLAHLDELGLSENTLVLFIGDNGTGRGVTSLLHGRPYDGGKGLTTCAGMHVPMIASWKGVIPSGRVNRDLIDSTDFLPTLCDAAGAKLPADLRVDGRSFLPQLRGAKGTPRDWFYCWYAPDGGPAAQREFAAGERYKLYRSGEIFDYVADPLEKAAAATAPDSVRRQLQAVLDEFRDARPPGMVKKGKKEK